LGGAAAKGMARKRNGANRRRKVKRKRKRQK